MTGVIVERDDEAVGVGAPRRRSRGRLIRIIALSIGVIFVGLSVVLATRLDQPADYRGTALLGASAPALTLPTLDGGSFEIGGRTGEVLIVNFFNSWCIPCQEEEPALRAFYARHRGAPDFEMVGIVRDDTERAIRRWVDERDIDWPVVLDPGARAAVDFATTGQPETFAIAPDGTIVAVHLGRATIDDLENMLAIARGDVPPPERVTEGLR